MNFLAHIYLSGESKEIIIGNFIADAVRRINYSAFAPGIVKGIELHHKIDEFTDCHPIVAESKNRLRPKYGKYSGVLVDIFYDHFLALDWLTYSKTPLTDYVVEIHELISENLAIMPPKIHQFLPYMISGNWLANYAYLEGIQSTLKGMSRRATFDSGMDRAMVDLKKDYEAYRKEFHIFFPELQHYVKTIQQG